MSTFLRQTAEALFAEHGTALREVAVVLPSQRAGLHLRNQLARLAGQPLWSPQLFTLGSFMEDRSGLRVLPMEELLFEGYEAYREAAGPEASSLGDFLQWGSTMLADFSEADAHLVPLERFYRDLRHWEEIAWTFNTDPLSEGQHRMVRYWALAGQVHSLLNARLLQRGAATAGATERAAALRPVDHGFPWKAAWFVGLNAFTIAQSAVLRRIADAGLARFAWDADRYVLDRPEQEAGMHLRTAMAAFGPGKVPASDRLVRDLPQVRTVRAPNGAAQAWCAAELLKAVPPDQRERTAVVLADEHLLQPLLEALPTDIGPLNITMGLPMARLPIGSFLQALHRLHAGHRPSDGFFHADVEAFLAHPFLRQGALAQATDLLLTEARAARRTFIPAGLIRDLAERCHLPAAAHVFTPVDQAEDGMPGVTLRALAWAQAATAGDALAAEQVYQAALVMQRIHALLHRYGHRPDPQEHALLLRRLMASARIALFGEPLAGLQVMGMLEARALDHDHVILLGAREGILPASDQGRSYIPFELRRELDMPLRDSQDAVQAYNFLHLLHRAQAVDLVWPEGAEPTGPSRFILQLGHELLKDRPDRLQALDARIHMPHGPTARVCVHKDEALLNTMRMRLEKGLSPSALGDWLRCPLDFHFKHVLRLREPEETGAHIAHNLLGEALHAVLEAVHRPLMGLPLQAAPLLEAAERMEPLLEAELAKHLPGTPWTQGQPLLQLRMATMAARRFLRAEADAAQRLPGSVVHALELELRQALPGAADAIGSPVHIKGRVDRVDVRQGQHLILDLKTGKVDPSKLSLPELSLDGPLAQRPQAVQLLVYAWLYLQAQPEVEAVQAGLLPLQHAESNKPVLLQWGGQNLIRRADLPAIAEMLTGVVRRMMDPAVPVEHDPRSDWCRFCLKTPQA